MPNKINSRTVSSSPDSFHSAKGITRSNSAKSNSSAKSKGPRAATHRRNKRAAAATKSKYRNEVFIDKQNNIGKDGKELKLITDEKQLEEIENNMIRKERYKQLGPPLSEKWLKNWKKQKKKGENALALAQIHHELMNNSDMGSFHRIGGKKKTKRRRKNKRRTKRRKC